MQQNHKGVRNHALCETMSPYSSVPFQKLHFRTMLAYPKIGPQYAIKRNGRAIEQQFIFFLFYFILEILSILVERKPAP